MGWSGGSRLFSNIIDVLQREISDSEKRQAIYWDLIQEFENEDWDTLDECMGEDPAYDLAVRELHPRLV